MWVHDLMGPQRRGHLLEISGECGFKPWGLRHILQSMIVGFSLCFIMNFQDYTVLRLQLVLLMDVGPRGLESITDREVSCYMISCKESTNIDAVINWLIKRSKTVKAQRTGQYKAWSIQMQLLKLQKIRSFESLGSTLQSRTINVTLLY